MATWYKSLIDETCEAIAAAWPDVGQIVRPEQMNRRNFAQDLESQTLRAPFAIVRVGSIASAPDYGAAGVALKARITVWWVDYWRGDGGDQTNDAVGECADLLARLAGTGQTNLDVITEAGVVIDGSADGNEALKRLLSLSLPLTAASLSFDVITGFTIADFV